MKNVIKIIAILLTIVNLVICIPTIGVYTYAANTQEDITNSESQKEDSSKDEKTQKVKTIKNKKKIKISEKKKTVYTGDSFKLKVTGTKQKVKWKSSDKKVAVVDQNGKVTTKKKGTALITAKVAKKELTCKVKVKAKSTKGVIFLTFDDGPSSTITPKVLDILKKEKVKATFFVLNYSKSNEHLIKRIVDEGHTIAIHGYSHDYSKIYRSKKTFMNNVYSLQKKIKKTTGVKTMYMRFPGGSSNTVSRRYNRGIMTRLTKEVLNKGFKYFDWNISSGDAGGAKNATQVYNNVVKSLSKNRGNMVLMHDFASNQKGLKALPKIIKYAKQHGYTFSAINDDTPMYAHHVNN